MKRTPSKFVRVETKIDWLVEAGAYLDTTDPWDHERPWVGIHVAASRAGRATVSLFMPRAAFARILFADWRDPQRERALFRQTARAVSNVVRCAQRAERQRGAA